MSLKKGVLLKYINAVFLYLFLATLFITPQALIQSEAEQDAFVLNISGKQRMLSQRITMHYLLQGMNEQKENQAWITTEIHALKSTYLKQLDQLSDTSLSSKMASIYSKRKIQEESIEFFEFLEKMKQQKSIYQNRMEIAQKSSRLLEQLDHSVYEFQDHVEEKVTARRLIQAITILLALGSAFLLYIVFVIPSEVSLRETRNQLEKENRALNHLQNNLKDLNYQLEHNLKLVDKNIITSSTDLDGVITDASEAFCTISEFEKEELIGNKHSIIRHPDNPESLYEDLWKTLESKKTWKGEIKNKKKNGGYYWVLATIEPRYNKLGEHIGFIAIRQDITDRKELEEVSIRDEMTGLYNRRHFNRAFPGAHNLARRNKKIFCFAILDVDHFKKYNDTYGHQNGDGVLKEVATAIQKSLQRPDDLSFRLGGEEFGVAFSADHLSGISQLLEDIRRSVEGLDIPHEANEAYGKVTVSTGAIYIDFSRHPDTQYDQDTAYRLADQELYRAKAAGRNRIFLESYTSRVETKPSDPSPEG